MTEQMNTPMLRFGEFDAEWSKQPLGQKMTIFRGASPRPKGDPRYYGGEIPRLMIQDATRDGKYTTPCIDFLTDEGAKKSRFLKAGSFVLSCSGTRVAIPTILAVDACVHDGWLAFKNYKDLESEFLYHLFVKFHERMQGSATTGGVFNNLTTEIMNNLLMSFPSVPEQQKIASFLSKVDEKIGLLSEKKDKLTEYKRGVMQQLFNGQWHEQDGQLTFIPPTRRFKADDGSEFPDWEEKTIENVCSVGTGNKDTQNRIDGGLYPFYVRSNTVERINSFSYDGEAILTSGDGVGVGKNYHYVNGKFDYHQRVYCLNEFKAGNNGKYIFYYFSEHFYRRVMRLSAKNSVDSVRRDMITKMLIPVPTEAEQTKIAHVLSAIDQKLDLANSELEKAKEWKRGLLQQIFV